MEFRILEINGSCFPQVRRRVLFLFWTPWERIAKHCYGFGLYNDLDHPETGENAENTIERFYKWKTSKKNRKIIPYSIQSS